LIQQFNKPVACRLNRADNPKKLLAVGEQELGVFAQAKDYTGKLLLKVHHTSSIT
jgi:hypothetical protein